MRLFCGLGSRAAWSLCWDWQAAVVAVPRPLVPQEPAPCSTHRACRNPCCPQVRIDEPCSKGKETPSGAEADLSDWEHVFDNNAGHEKEEGRPENRRTNESCLPPGAAPLVFRRAERTETRSAPTRPLQSRRAERTSPRPVQQRARSGKLRRASG